MTKLISLLILLTSVISAEIDFKLSANIHPSLITTSEEGLLINSSKKKYSILDRTFQSISLEIEDAMMSTIEVPEPGEAGGYSHEKHKQNYRDMRKAGELFVITNNEKYAKFVKEMLQAYSKLYPKLGLHPLAKHQKPGKIFHQMLNEAVWLTNVSIAYDCIYNWLDEKSRKEFEKNIFSPMVELFTVRNFKEFDKIHNHGMWACAAVGMYGIVIRDENLVEMALYGTKKNGKGGFLRNLDELFSPDGYYMEGPYYIRYAIRPLIKFAESLERNLPHVKIYSYRNSIIKKAYYSAINTTFPNGIFFPINDASKTMDIKAPGMIFGNSIINYRYGADSNLLKLLDIQKKVVLNNSGHFTSKAYFELDPDYKLSLNSIEYSDGNDGEKGGLGILRTGSSEDQSVLVMKYGVHGMGHGHFDKLHFLFYNQNREIINDYGFSRWINIEPKYGGRYLPENNSYAKSTIAHNTVVVNMENQNEGIRKKADQVYASRHFFDSSDPNIQVVSAWANNHYLDIKMQRTMFLINDDELEYPIVLDVFKIDGQKTNTYDYPIHYTGQIINTSFTYDKNLTSLNTLGNKDGYEHIWVEATSKINKPSQITWLDGNRYYTLTMANNANSEIIFGRIGANDPNFNLKSEPMLIYRNTSKDLIYASVIEPHGYFNESSESSLNASGIIETVSIVGFNQKATVIEVQGKNDLKWQIIINNQKSKPDEKNKILVNGEFYEWVGNYAVN